MDQSWYVIFSYIKLKLYYHLIKFIFLKFVAWLYAVQVASSIGVMTQLFCVFAMCSQLILTIPWKRRSMIMIYIGLLSTTSKFS